MKKKTFVYMKTLKEGKRKKKELLRDMKNINRENRNKKELLLQMKMLLLFFSRSSSESLHIATFTCLDNNDTMPHVMWHHLVLFSNLRSQKVRYQSNNGGENTQIMKASFVLMIALWCRCLRRRVRWEFQLLIATNLLAKAKVIHLDVIIRTFSVNLNTFIIHLQI